MKDLMHDDEIVVPAQQSTPHEQLPENQPRRIHVGPAIQLFLRRLFGGHVDEFALGISRTRGSDPRFRTRHAEVHDARNPIDANENVLR